MFCGGMELRLHLKLFKDNTTFRDVCGTCGFFGDARGRQCSFLLCLHPQGCLRRGPRVPLRGEGSCGGGGAPRDSAGSGATEEGLTSPPRAPQLEETPETPPSSRAEGLLFLHGLESNPGSSLQTEEEAALP